MPRILSEWIRDLHHALRSLRRLPSFAVTAVVTLALAIGATAGMFSVVDTVLLRPLPYPNPNRLVYVAGSAPGSDLPKEFGVGDEFYEQYRERSHLLRNVAVFNSFTSTFRVGDRVERIRMSEPTNTLFATLGATPILGRLPVDADQDRAIVLSYGLWRDWFGGDSSVIGKSYFAGGQMRTVIGVMGPEFRFPTDGTELWISYQVDPAQIRVGNLGDELVARMKPGVTIDQLRRELNGLAKQIPERFGGSPHYRDFISRHQAVVRPLETELLGQYARPLWVLLGAAAIVFIIACTNVANLFMVRGERRHRELAVRRAIGAARSQLVRLQLAEAVLIAGAAAVLAAMLAFIILPLFLRAAPSGVPRLEDVRVGTTTILFTVAAAAVAALACGLLPALRSSSPDLTRLREGGRGSTARRHWGRDGLVAAQTAMALVLLIGSGLLVRSFWALRDVNPGYSTTNIFTFQIAPQRASLNDGPTFARFDLAFMDRLRALPGVQSVGLVDNVPLDEGTGSTRFRTEEMSGDNPGVLLHYTISGGDYFKTMSIPVLAGRAFDRADALSAKNHVVVSKSAAALLWPREDPIGRRLRVMQGADSTAWFTVIGVVGDVMQSDFRDRPDPLLYIPLVGPRPMSWAASSPAYVVKTPRAESMAPVVRALAHEVAPEAPMYRVFTMAGLARRSMVQLSFTMLTLGIAASLALLLGAVGLYGVLSYVVAERTREIGVRMALGATAEQVRGMVVAQGARVLAAGTVVGVGVALASTRALGSLLYGVHAVDLSVFLGMSVSMILIGLFASYMPARRASAVDPMESLRSD
jgi:putative ABC transport system permease protein